MIVTKSYEKTNNSIRYAARKVSNDSPPEMTDDEIIAAVSAEIGRPLNPELQQDKVAIRAFREHRKDAERASERPQ